MRITNQTRDSLWNFRRRCFFCPEMNCYDVCDVFAEEIKKRRTGKPTFQEEGCTRVIPHLLPPSLSCPCPTSPTRPPPLRYVLEYVS